MGKLHRFGVGIILIRFAFQKIHRMKKEEAIEQLTELRRSVTKLGHAYIQDKPPISIPEFCKELEPFGNVEKAFYEAIEQVKKSKF